LAACTQRHNPQAAFEHAFHTFQSGDMIGANREAEQGYKEFRGLNSEWAWKFTILRARVLIRRGEYAEGLRVLNSEPSSLPSEEMAVKKDWLEGAALTSMRRFEEAQAELRKAEGPCANTDYAVCGDVVTTRGTLEMERGRYDQARPFFQRALAIAQTHGDQIWEADARLDLSWCALEQTHFDEALTWAEAALQISTLLGYGGGAQKALGDEGWASYKLGDLTKAEDMFVRAQAQAEKIGEVPDQIKWTTAAAYIDLDTGQAEVARSAFSRSLNLAQKIGSPEDIINSLIALAFVSEQTNHLDDARRYADDALAKAIEDHNGRDQVYPRLVQGRIAARMRDTAEAETAFQEVARSPDTPVFLKWEAERSLARLYEDERHLDAAQREYRTALTTFEGARSELKHEDLRLPFLTNAARIYDDYIHFLIAHGKNDAALQVADFSRGRTLAEGLGIASPAARKTNPSFDPTPLNAPSIARRAGATILFYWLGEKQSYLWVVTPAKTIHFPLPSSAEIEAAAQRYRKALSGPQDVLASADADGQYLYRTLIAPAQPSLKKNSKVLIIPDGGLNNLNFETTLVPDKSVSDKHVPDKKSIPNVSLSGQQSATVVVPKASLHYWIEDATVANASSLRILASAPAAKPNRSRSLLLIGDSVSPSDKYPQLSQAAAQMQSVAKHFPQATETVITREQATPQSYLSSNPERFSYIHFVAHGTASRLSPLDSAIVLSRPHSNQAASEDSFKLYARDIIQHPLRAELVTVSACYSAGERAYSGEGLVGLSWAFLRAGAHNVIAALWDASDAPTEDLMDKFYEELNRGAAPDAALRAAKLSLLHGKFRNPFYWAPFQLYARLN
jgi:CHAT domain-containing protein